MAAAAAVIAVTVLGASPAMAATSTSSTSTPSTVNTQHWSGTYSAGSTAGTLTTTLGAGDPEYTFNYNGTLTVSGSGCYQLFILSSFGFSGYLYYLGQQCGTGTTVINYAHQAISPTLYLLNCPTTQFCGTGTTIPYTA